MGYLIFNFGIVPGLLAILISQAGNNAPFLQLGRHLHTKYLLRMDSSWMGGNTNPSPSQCSTSTSRCQA